MRTKNIWLYIFWIALIASASCARRGVPTGGPKDTIPPTLVRMSPTLETVNFDDDNLVLEFDEYIEARSLKQDIIVNPPVEDYDFYVNRRSVVIELNEDLQDNTTYTFNFRDAIKDISEQNPAENIIMALSTGNEIDSFQVNGQVKELFTNKAVDDVLVALYPEGDTLNPFEDPPTYLTKTDEEGNYAIRYIKVGTYKIYAYTDNNNNLKLDPNTEAYGFESEPIVLIPEEAKPIALDSMAIATDSTQQTQKNLYGKEVNLELIRLDTRDIQVQSARANGKYFEIKTNKALKDYELIVDDANINEETKEYLDSLNTDLPTDTTQYVYSNFQDNHKTIRLYNTLRQDSVQATITLQDSVNQSITDTIQIKFVETKREIDQLKQNITSNNNIKSYINTKIKFSKPIAYVNTDSILLSYDTLFYLPIAYKSFLSWNDKLDEVSLEKEIDKTKLIDTLLIKLKSRDSISYTLKIVEARNYLDSLKNSNDLNEQLRLFNLLTQRIPSLRNVADSINTIETESVKSQILANVADSINISSSFTPNIYNREELKENLKPLILYISAGSFISIENDSSQRIIQKYNFKKPSEHGKITGTINTEFQNYTLQLLNNNYELVEEQRPTSNTYTFELIPPGEYHIRILIDENNNGQWDNANILENRKAEPVYFYNEEEVIDLRANWTREIDISF